MTACLAKLAPGGQTYLFMIADTVQCFVRQRADFERLSLVPRGMRQTLSNYARYDGANQAVAGATEMIEAVCLLCNIVDGKWWPYYLPTYLCEL